MLGVRRLAAAAERHLVARGSEAWQRFLPRCLSLRSRPAPKAFSDITSCFRALLYYIHVSFHRFQASQLSYFTRLSLRSKLRYRDCKPRARSSPPYLRHLRGREAPPAALRPPCEAHTASEWARSTKSRQFVDERISESRLPHALHPLVLDCTNEVYIRHAAKPCTRR